MKVRVATSLVLIAWAAGCFRGGNSETVHPTEENLTSGIDHVLTVEIRAADSVGQEETELISILEEMQERAVLGSDGQELFGRIEDVVFDAYNRVYVLDWFQQAVQVFSSEGMFITTLGGKGEGPGEFDTARSMAIFNDEKLLVANGHRIEVFEIREEGIEFAETVQLEQQILSICTAGDRLFTHSSPIARLSEASQMESGPLPIIHAYALPSFEMLFSFGESYLDDNAMVVDRMSIGDLSCNEVSSTVLLAFEMMPVLHGYATVDGRLKWKTRIDGLSFSSVTEITTNGIQGVQYSPPEIPIVDRMSRPVSINNEYNLFQIKRTILPEPGSFESESRTLSFMLNSETGEGVRLDGEFPPVMQATGHLLASPSENLTKVRIYAIE